MLQAALAPGRFKLCSLITVLQGTTTSLGALHQQHALTTLIPFSFGDFSTR